MDRLSEFSCQFKLFRLVSSIMADEVPVEPKSPEEGDVVQLKSGGPKMTIDKILPSGTVICSWFDAEKPDVRHRETFRAKMLQPVI